MLLIILDTSDRSSILSWLELDLSGQIYSWSAWSTPYLMLLGGGRTICTISSSSMFPGLELYYTDRAHHNSTLGSPWDRRSRSWSVQRVWCLQDTPDEIERFVETHLGKLRAILRSRMLRYGLCMTSWSLHRPMAPLDDRTKGLYSTRMYAGPLLSKTVWPKFHDLPHFPG